jgi:Protein of unknown function (DUF1490)
MQKRATTVVADDRREGARHLQCATTSMVVHGLMAKATGAALTGTVGAVAYDLLRMLPVKAPIREAVTTTAWGLHNASSVGVVANSARLIRYQLPN